MQDEKQPSSIQVIERMTRLLDTLAASDQPLSLKILAGNTGLHPSTAFRILASLAEHGFVERSSLGHYRLGSKLLQLGNRVQGQFDLRREAKPIMEWLCAEINETVNLILREDDDIVYVERVTPQRMMRVEQTIGGHLPLHTTAVGKLFLAESGAEGCLEYAERSGLPGRTAHSITDPAALWRNVKDALRQGYALDDQEAELGVGCIGVPVRDGSGQMIAGISVSAPFARRSLDWIPIMQRAAAKLSSRLGFQPPDTDNRISG